LGDAIVFVSVFTLETSGFIGVFSCGNFGVLKFLFITGGNLQKNNAMLIARLVTFTVYSYTVGFRQI